jgi:PAS domain S-box-containing protein
MRVGELSRRTGVGVSTLRAWERRFRFLEPQRSPAGHRLYTEIDVERVAAVLRLVEEGFTLAAAIARVASAGTAALPDGEGEALLYAQILQAADEGIWVAKDGRTRYANRRMAELMGYTVEELVARPVVEFLNPEMLAVRKDRLELMRAGKRLHITQEVTRADGSTFLAEIKTTSLRDPAGRFEGVVALVNDITARNEAETQAHLRATLLDSIGEAVTASTPDGTVVYVNTAAERLFGLRAADVIGRASRDVFPGSEEAEHRERVLPLLQQRKRQSGRYKMVRRDGSPFVARFTAAPAVDEHGALVGFVGVIRDETEHDQLHRALLTRERQAETLALLGVQALRQRVDPSGTATLITTEAAEATRRLLGADQAMVLDLVTGANELHAIAASPPIDERIVVPAGSRSFAGYITLAHKVIVVDNANHDQRFDVYVTPAVAPIASAIGAPVFGPNGIVGVLTAESSARNQFDQGDAHFVQAVANIVGTALLP